MISTFLFRLSHLAFFGLAAATITRATFSLYSWLEMFYWLGLPLKATPDALQFILSGQSEPITHTLHVVWLLQHPMIQQGLQASAHLMPVCISLLLLTVFMGLLVKLMELTAAQVAMTQPELQHS
jgi:hypothetical protein